MDKIPVPKTALDLDERKRIYSLLIQGYSCIQISKIISRGKNTVISEVKRNGGRENYNPYEANESAWRRKSIRIKNLTKTITSNPSPYKILLNRIENLEMQVEILIDCVMQLKGKK